MNNKEIFLQSKIKKVSSVRFGNDKIQCKVSGFMGFGDINKYGIKYPYAPSGGRNALKIIKESGLLNYDCINWVKPCSMI
ncbi:hypothetical protein EXM65_15400 [Clostridium botulinum]|uniref:Uncharacterized protein n=1 Tax=Clostridium botulinum TaxID=1491 RepID=A0A6M0SUA4_CLOBO|nr:hypothetical protein [Clostridium botulinum]